MYLDHTREELEAYGLNYWVAFHFPDDMRPSETLDAIAQIADVPGSIEAKWALIREVANDEPEHWDGEDLDEAVDRYLGREADQVLNLVAELQEVGCPWLRILELVSQTRCSAIQ
ncbi:MAG TPA: hypothetical protein DDW52_16635 [Planctomycetaceae bacterium]|nr:hypothetical protein [Planctomycetaceae bacterium]